MKVLRNSNQQLLNRLEELKESKTKVRVSHSQLKISGVISRIFIGRYKLFIEVDSGSTLNIFPADLSTITVSKTGPEVEPENLQPSTDSTARAALATMHKLTATKDKK